MALAAATHGATRVAIISTGQTSTLKNIAAVAEAELSADDNFTLLERGQIDRVLAEQKLSLTGAVDSASAIQVGKILATDLLVILEAQPDSTEFGVVIFDPVTGIQLWDAAASEPKGAAVAAGIVNAVKSAARKRTDVAHRKTVCVLAVRNGDLSRDFDGWCDAVGRLTERGMIGSPSVAMLERSRLDQVTRERGIAADASTRDLVASLVIIDLEIDRGIARGGFKATALLSDAASHPLGKVTVELGQRDAVALASSLVAALNQNLKSPATVPLDNRAEAARFCGEALFRISNSDFAHAVAPAEAAHALSPADPVYRAVLARCLIDAGWQQFRIPDNGLQGGWENHSVAPPTVLRGSRMLADDQAAAPPADPAVAKQVHDQFLDALATLRKFVSTANFFHEREPLTTNDIPTVQASLRRILLTENVRRSELAKDQPTFDEYSDFVRDLLLDSLRLFSASSTQWVQDLRDVAQHWLQTKAKVGAACSPREMAVVELFAIGWQFKGFDGINFPGERNPRWPIGPQELAALATIQQRLQSSPDPILARYANLMNFSLSICQEPRNPESLKAAATSFVIKLTDGLSSKNSTAARQVDYRMMIIADELLNRGPYDGQLSMQIADSMLARHEILRVAINRATRKFMNEDEAAHLQRQKRVLEAAAKVAEASDCVLLDDVTLPRTKVWLADSIRGLGRNLYLPPATAPLPPADASWYGSRRLIDLAEATTPTQCLYFPCVDGESIYTLAAVDPGDQQPYRLRLLKLALSGGKPQPLGEFASSFNYRGQQEPEQRLMVAQIVLNACVADGYYAAAVGRDGVLLFPTAGGEPIQLNDSIGMPANRATAVALLDGVVFAALGAKDQQTYIASCDISSKRVSVIASSVRKDKQSPFDDGRAFQVVNLIADAPRRRLIATIVRHDEPPSNVSGIWEYKLATRAWRQLLPINLFFEVSTTIDDIRPAGTDGLLVQVSGGIFLFDLKVDQPRKVYLDETDYLAIPRQTPRLSRVSDAFADSMKNAWQAFTWQRTIRLSNLDRDWLWTSFGRISLSNGSIQRFENPRRRDRYWMDVVNPLSDGRLLLGDNWGLLLIDPGPNHPQTRENLTPLDP